MSFWAVFQRVAAAVIGGYALANLLPLALVKFLPIGRAETVMTALLLSFAFYAAAIIWVFAARSVWRAWAGLLLLAVPAGLLLIAKEVWP